MILFITTNEILCSIHESVTMGDNWLTETKDGFRTLGYIKKRLWDRKIAHKYDFCIIIMNL